MSTFHYTPYHRFKTHATSGDWDLNNASAIRGNFSANADDDALRDNVDFADDFILSEPEIASNNSEDNVKFSEIIPSHAIIVGFQLRYYAKWYSGTSQKQIGSYARIGSDGAFSGGGISGGNTGLNSLSTTPQLVESNTTLGGVSFNTLTDADDIQIKFISLKIIGTSPRIAIMGSGFGDATYEASPSIRIRYRLDNKISVIGHSTKLSITGNSKLIVN